MPAALFSISVRQVMEISSTPWKSSDIPAQDAGGPEICSIVHSTKHSSYSIRTYNSHGSKKVAIAIIAAQLPYVANPRARVVRVGRSMGFSHFAIIKTTDLPDLQALQAHWLLRLS